MSRSSRTFARMTAIVLGAILLLNSPVAGGLAFASAVHGSVAVGQTPTPTSSTGVVPPQAAPVSVPTTSVGIPETTTATSAPVTQRPPLVRVPRVVGLQPKVAIRVLRKAGFRVYIGKSVHSKVRAKRVAKQTLRAGAFVQRRARIRLVASLGPKPRYKWHSAVSSNYGNEPQSVAGPYPSTGYMDARGMPYFANKSMPFRTKIIFSAHGRQIVGFCADRGPYVGHREFDMGTRIMRALHLDGVDNVRWAYAR